MRRDLVVRSAGLFSSWTLRSLATLALISLAQRPSHASCPDGPLPLPNVVWGLKDSVAACPAGDTLTLVGHPSKLRVVVYYQDADCNAKVGVPPESISISTSIVSGNLALNDMASTIYADDSTDASGRARFTLSSFSGCGKIRIYLSVSGASQGSKDALVRSVDGSAYGRVTGSDVDCPCDLNYNGVTCPNDAVDLSEVYAHAEHWHRNALFGTPVRRTSLCETCSPDSTGTIGDSEPFWSPDGKRLAFTIHVGPLGSDSTAACRVFLARSDSREGNGLVQFSFDDTADVHDYDPSWSPVGDVIAFDRYERRILRKGIPGVAGDTSTYLVTASGDLNHSGDLTPAISPDGQWVAFSRRDNGPRHLYKVPVGGGIPTQLTSEADGVDFYPQWSDDGNWIVFDRQNGLQDQHHLVYKVKTNGDSLQAVYVPPSGKDAATPSFTPDAALVLFGFGTHDSTDSNSPRDVTTRTMDLGLGMGSPLTYYSDSTFAAKGHDPLLFPRLSPDGTRLALRSKEIWAVRRNMNLPPELTQIGTQAVADTTTTVSINVKVGLQSTITVTATDPESDPITYSAYFLKSGMTFSPSTQTLTWTPPGPVGSTDYVRFEVNTPSGGTDAIVAILHTVSALGPSTLERQRASDLRFLGPNPTAGGISFSTPPIAGAMARLEIFDVAGRRIAVTSSTPGRTVRWDGLETGRGRAPPGVYSYRVVVGPFSKSGRFVVAR